jgi:hypothetical protein
MPRTVCFPALLTNRLCCAVQILAERDLAGSIIYELMGPGLTGNLVRARAKAIFYELDKDGSGGLTPDELQDWFARCSWCMLAHLLVFACEDGEEERAFARG